MTFLKWFWKFEDFLKKWLGYKPATKGMKPLRFNINNAFSETPNYPYNNGLTGITSEESAKCVELILEIRKQESGA